MSEGCLTNDPLKLIDPTGMAAVDRCSTGYCSTTKPDDFAPVHGSSAKVNKETGEVWVKDRLHNNHYEIYKNKKAFDWETERETISSSFFNVSERIHFFEAT